MTARAKCRCVLASNRRAIQYSTLQICFCIDLCRVTNRTLLTRTGRCVEVTDEGVCNTDVPIRWQSSTTETKCWLQTGYEEFKNQARHDRKVHLLQRRLRTKIHASRVGSVPFSLRHNSKLNWCTNMGVWGQWQHHTIISQFWSTSYDKNISIEHVLELLKRVTPYSHIHRISSHH